MNGRSQPPTPAERGCKVKRRTQQFWAAFAITGILIFALCGFALVDLSTERYMPADCTPLFQITGVDAEGVYFSAANTQYRIDAAPVETFKDSLWTWRGFLPSSVRQTGYLTAKGYIALKTYLEQSQESQVFW